MSEKELTQLKAYIVYLNEYYQRPALSDMVVKMYASDLSDLPFSEVMAAFETYRKNPRNKTAPLPSVIREIIRPEIDDETYAISTAARVLEAVTKFGYNWKETPSPAKEYVGEIGWVAVDSFGGWNYICENLGTSKLSVTSFQAQVREITKSQVKVVKAGGNLPKLEHFQKNQLQAPQNVVNLLDLKIREVPKDV